MGTCCVEKLLCETRRVALALAEVADDTLAPLGISSMQRAVLETLLREGRPLSLVTLARKQLVTPEVLAQMSDGEQSGLADASRLDAKLSGVLDAIDSAVVILGFEFYYTILKRPLNEVIVLFICAGVWVV